MLQYVAKFAKLDQTVEMFPPTDHTGHLRDVQSYYTYLVINKDVLLVGK